MWRNIPGSQTMSAPAPTYRENPKGTTSGSLLIGLFISIDRHDHQVACMSANCSAVLLNWSLVTMETSSEELPVNPWPYLSAMFCVKSVNAVCPGAPDCVSVQVVLSNQCKHTEVS